MSHTIPKSHVTVIRKGGSILPQVNLTPCTPACTFYVDCANFSQNQPCQGFKLLQNGNAVNRILQNLSEDDKIYVERCMERILQTTDTEEKELLNTEVLRWLDPADRKPKERRFTFRGFEPYEIDENGTLSIPQPNEEKPDIQRAFSMTAFTPPETCDPDTCPNVFCESRRAENKGHRCFYARPLTNAEINQRTDKKWQKQ